MSTNSTETPAFQAAAFHGLATNQAYPIAERLALALNALGLYEAELQRHEAVMHAARAWRAARPGPWVAGADVEYRLFAAVDALDGAS